MALIEMIIGKFRALELLKGFLKGPLLIEVDFI